MPDDSLFVSMEAFSGLNTVDDPTRLSPERTEKGDVWPLVSATNIDIDNTMRPVIRDGYSLAVAGTRPHSIWSNKNKTQGFFVEGETLYALNPDESVTTIRRGLAVGARMSYAEAFDRVYYTNGYQIGYVNKDLENYGPTDPGITFKYALPPGQLIAFYRGILYVASGSVIYASDVLAHHYDKRRGFWQMEGSITLLRPVDEGIFIADGKTWFMKGRTKADIEKDPVDDANVLIYSDVMTPEKYINPGSPERNNVAVWMSTRGICIGTNDGRVLHATEGRYKWTADYTRGGGLLKLTAGKEMYIGVATL